jgi:hypothetical protein
MADDLAVLMAGLTVVVSVEQKVVLLVEQMAMKMVERKADGLAVRLVCQSVDWMAEQMVVQMD